MKNVGLFFILFLAVLLSGCVQSGPKCSPPYMEYGDMGYCCLDANQNSICDRYEKGVPSTTSMQTTHTVVSKKSTSTTTLP